MSSLLENAAIIGAGLGGCAAAIALSKQGIPVTVYESKPQDSDVLHSGVQLTPNGLRVLDHLGLYSRIKGRCYISNYRTFKNDRDETVKKVTSGDAKQHGFCNHRIWRSVLLDTMKAMLAETSVDVKYDSRFEGIIGEDGRSVRFTINGSTQHASLLIASDGIHSTVRKLVAPGIEPYYTGVTGVISHIPRASVAWPYEDYERNATIHGKPSAIFFIAEDPEAKILMTGIQVNYPEQSREDLDHLQRDKDRQVAFYQHGYEEHGATAKSIIDAVVANKDACYIWPFMKMPKLERWYSDAGKFIIMGDAAHALPPSSAQGVNQALEDAYTLTLVLRSIQSKPESELTGALSIWQSRRQNRIDDIFDWATNVTNVTRLPEEERARLKAEGKLNDRPNDDMGWLYGYDAEQDFKDFS